MKAKLSLYSVGVALLVLMTSALRPVPLFAQTDLDAFMKKVLARRDDSWKKLQQYILNERDVVELRGPGQLPVWGERREFTWFLRDGYFVRSPLTVNGVKIGDAERVKYEADYVRHEKDREKRARARELRLSNTGVSVTAPPTEPTTPAADAPASVEGLIAQTREPQFISSAYFLKFKFEEGKYALVGREKLDGTDTLKIEYYPARLFTNDAERNQGRVQRGEPVNKDRQMSAAIETAANKVSLVTLWVEPKSNQIVKYVFDNVNLDFLPGAAFVRLSDVKATMQMGQPFVGTAASTSNPTPDVWLPKNVNMYIALMVAVGQFDMRVSMDYTDYKLAETSSRIK
ncbi:MAG: hypothetical protein WCQ64_07810 [Acidobacteriota bacterium]